MLNRLFAGAFALAFVSSVAHADECSRAPEEPWVASWGAAMQAPMGDPAKVVDNQTLRQIVRLSLGGRTLRIRFSNALGKSPLKIAAASVGVPTAGANVAEGTLHALHFGAARAITIAPHSEAVSDPVDLRVEPGSDLAVSVFIPEPTPADSQLTTAQQTSYLSGAGDFSDSAQLPAASGIGSWFWLTSVEVRHYGASSIVAFGDSITEGYGSTTDANARWPDVLAQRLLHCRAARSVIDSGIGGNRVLNDEFGPNAQSRLDRDLLTRAGAKYAILLEGINDIGFSVFKSDEFPFDVARPDVSAKEIIAGYHQIIERSHAAGIKIYGGTLLPFVGAAYQNQSGEDKRQEINRWIRTSGAFDGVIDFDKVTRDPDHPDELRSAYDSGDHLHPNDAGYRAMGEAIDLRLFGVVCAN